MVNRRISPQNLIVFENDDYLVINKPAGISTLEDRSNPSNILTLFREINPEVSVCHRLDKETSGALLLAKHDEAYREAALKFESREVEKVYHALVKGGFTDETLQVDMPLRIAGSGRVKADPRKGKEATTLFRTKKNYKGFTLVEAKPISGRRHQIRVHLNYLNSPICGDEFYGGEPIFLSNIKKHYKLAEGRTENPLFNRVALHAHSIELQVMGHHIKVECPYPKDIEMILSKIEKFG